MSESKILLDYRGHIDLTVIELLLEKLKKSKDFTALNIPTGKRTYSIVVECLDNIFKHSEFQSSYDPDIQSYISIREQNDTILIIAGNPVAESTKYDLTRKLDRLNSLDEAALKTLHENIINSESVKGTNGAGLGFITMALKSENKIGYSFEPLINGYVNFEIQISLIKYIMRKLIINKTSRSPKVILDPYKKIYLISGESRPADVTCFYDQILSWLKEFGTYMIKSDNKKDPVTFNFDFTYFSSSSGKLILDIFKVLASLHLKGFNIKVNWHFEKDDLDMHEAGMEMSNIVKLPFEYIESGTK
jgi:hypothetical protein